MNRNMLYALVAGLAIVVVVLGVGLQRERDKTSGISIDITKEHGLTIEHKN